MAEVNLRRSFFLPRLPREYYQGDAVVHWTMPISHRRSGWLDESFHLGFKEQMLHTAARQKLLCPIYCLMPDHLHLVWMGLQRNSDQRNAMAFLRTNLRPKLAPHRFQHQAHDHILKQEERRRNAFARVCNYILENPLRASLIEPREKWPFSGAIVPGFPNMHPLEPWFWQRFWKIYAETKESDAAQIRKPPIHQARSSRRQEAQISLRSSL